MPQTEETLAQLNTISNGHLPGLIGIRFTDTGDGWVEAECPVRREIMAPNGFLHAASVVALADTACGYGCTMHLPEGARGFTTIELKSNFTGTAREGVIECRAEARHRGRTTQLWDATVKHRDTDKVIAHFRCTQMVLWPK